VVNPGLKLAIAAESVPVFEHPVKHVLYHILTQFPLACHVKKEAKQRTVVPFEQQAQFIQVAVFHLQHQGIIIKRVQAGIGYVYTIYERKLRKLSKVTEKAVFFKQFGRKCDFVTFDAQVFGYLMHHYLACHRDHLNYFFHSARIMNNKFSTRKYAYVVFTVQLFENNEEKGKFELLKIGMITINHTLDTIMKLDVSSREMLLEILQKRPIEDRRSEIASNGKKAKAAYKSGKIVPATAGDVIHRLNAL
jgi:hypothetical protein